MLEWAIGAAPWEDVYLLSEDCIWVAGSRELVMVGAVLEHDGVGLCGFNCDCRARGYL